MKNKLQPSGLWRYFAIALLLGAFTLAAYAALTRKGRQLIDVVVEIQPSPEGHFFIESQDVIERLDGGPAGALIGQSVDQLSLEALEQQLQQDPFVANADLYTGYDGRLHATIVQNEPLLRVHHRGGQDYYIGPAGEILPLSKHDVARVMVMTGEVPSFNEAVADSLAIEAYTLVRAIRADEMLTALIEQISYSKGQYVLIPKLGSAEICIGTLENLEEKFSRLNTFLRGVTPEVGWEAYTRIDLSYNGQVVCKRRKVRA